MNLISDQSWTYLASVSKRVFIQNLSYENEFDLHEKKHVCGAHFQKYVFFDR